MRIGAIILAGGRGKRMGQPKDSLPFVGEPLLLRAIRVLRPACAPLVTVARSADQALPPLPADVERTHDRPGADGPLAGLAAGLAWLGTAGGLGARDLAFATACDLPFVSAELVTWLAARIGEHDCVMPRAFGVLQPLCALYRLDALRTAERLLAAGIATPRSLHDELPTRLVDEAELRTFDPELTCLTNVNSREQLAAAEARARR